MLSLLTATGWAANHFSAMIPVLHTERGYSDTFLAGVFGIYAVGLLPGLLAGGAVSDRLGRARVALPGAIVAAGGTLILLTWHDPTGLLTGRFVVGLGAGATFSAGTAWMADIGGRHGATVAGVALTAGFGGGPVASGLLATGLPHSLVVPFAVSLALSALAVAGVVASRVAVRESTPSPPVSTAAAPSPDVRTLGRSSRKALTWAIPIGPFVFTSAAIGLITLPGRLPGDDTGPLLAGVAAGLGLGSGMLAQFVARRRGRPYGVTGLACSAAGMLLLAAAGDLVGLGVFVLGSLLLGIAYGLCLHAGLSDLDRWAPPERRGALTGMFFVATYLGFGVPLLLEWLEPEVGGTWPLVWLAAIAGAVAVARAVRGSRPVRPSPPAL